MFGLGSGVPIPSVGAVTRSRAAQDAGADGFQTEAGQTGSNTYTHIHIYIYIYVYIRHGVPVRGLVAAGVLQFPLMNCHGKVWAKPSVHLHN